MRNICFLLVPDFDQHSKIEFRKLCLYLYLSQGGVLRDGKMGLMKDLVVFGQRFFLSKVILYHQYIICRGDFLRSGLNKKMLDNLNIIQIIHLTFDCS